MIRRSSQLLCVWFLTWDLAVTALAWVGATSAQAADQKLYGVLLKTLSNPFWGAMQEGIQDGAKAAGVEYYLQAVESDQAAEPQLNVCNTMLERKPTVMITAAINSTNLLPCLKNATDQGIPVVDLDANLDHAIAKQAGVDIAFTIGSDNVQAGRQGALQRVRRGEVGEARRDGRRREAVVGEGHEDGLEDARLARGRPAHRDEPERELPEADLAHEVLGEVLLNGVDELVELCDHGDSLRLRVCLRMHGSRPTILARCGGAVSPGVDP